jgi:hypothetical protein
MTFLLRFDCIDDLIIRDKNTLLYYFWQLYQDQKNASITTICNTLFSKFFFTRF